MKVCDERLIYQYTQVNMGGGRYDSDVDDKTSNCPGETPSATSFFTWNIYSRDDVDDDRKGGRSS